MYLVRCQIEISVPCIKEFDIAIKIWSRGTFLTAIDTVIPNQDCIPIPFVTGVLISP